MFLHRVLSHTTSAFGLIYHSGNRINTVAASQQRKASSMSADNLSTNGIQIRMVKQTIKHLHDSVKIVAASNCAAHSDRPLCDCPTALDSLTPANVKNCKTTYFQMVWESSILQHEHTYAFDGSQAAHKDLAPLLPATIPHPST